MENVKVGIGVLIIDGDQILLGHRTKNYEDTGGIHEEDTWSLPGGKQEFGETYFECAIREVKEETNLSISHLSLFGVSDDISNDRQFDTIQVVAKKYHGKLKVMETSKLDEWRWFSLNDLPTNIYSPSKKFIDEYINKVWKKYKLHQELLDLRMRLFEIKAEHHSDSDEARESIKNEDAYRETMNRIDQVRKEYFSVLSEEGSNKDDRHKIN